LVTQQLQVHKWYTTGITKNTTGITIMLQWFTTIKTKKAYSVE